VDRFRTWLAFVGWQRFTFVVAAAPVVAFVAWWMVRLPAPPVESLIPVAPSAVTAAPSEWVSPLQTLAPSRIAVHVVGAVRQPGVYHLAAGARADDALRAAGGASDNADLRRVNLAASVLDGDQLYIPRIGERLPNDSPSTNESNGNPGAPTRASNNSNNSNSASATSSTLPLIVDLNRATATDLDRLPGVGPATAKAIIDHRTRNGPFASVDDLLKVKGIGPAKLAEIRPWVKV
jgi:competence protein ComEA